MVIGLAPIGLLAKGPVAIVLCAGSVLRLGARGRGGCGALAPRCPGSARQCCWWLALALPWYLLAEARDARVPDYFIVGEHWNRFTGGLAG